jgi:hypothetical protein
VGARNRCTPDTGPSGAVFCDFCASPSLSGNRFGRTVSRRYKSRWLREGSFEWLERSRALFQPHVCGAALSTFHSLLKVLVGRSASSTLTIFGHLWKVNGKTQCDRLSPREAWTALLELLRPSRNGEMLGPATAFAPVLSFKRTVPMAETRYAL